MSVRDSLMETANQHGHAALDTALQGSALGDMSGLLDKLHEGGLSEAVEAWADGEDHPAPDAGQIRDALGEEHVEQLAASMGIPAEELLQTLADHLPALAKAHLEAEGFEEAEGDADSDDEDHGHDDEDIDEGEEGQA